MSEAGAGQGPEIIVALDYADPAEAFSMVERLPTCTWYKVGLELFTRAGPPTVERLVGEGRNVFLDLKLHDIPNTVAGAVHAARGLGARLVTLHASGGEPMLRAAVEAARDGSRGGEDVRLLAVTVLTSLDDESLAPVMGPGALVEDAVGRLAGLARECGIDGVVSSVDECRAVKLACGPDFLVATPGIRPAGGDTDDQKRVATPAVARRAGADYLVVGRAVTRAPEPAAALERIRAELEE
jgi:orotidine-5'-phosphate decarboxylase